MNAWPSLNEPMDPGNSQTEPTGQPRRRPWKHKFGAARKTREDFLGAGVKT